MTEDMTDETLEPEAQDSEAVSDDPKKVSRDRLMKFAQTHGNISELLDASELTRIGCDVVEDYERDEESCAEWKENARKSLAQAAQDKLGPKNYPFDLASNIQYPTLTVAAQQFAARAYPAIVKGDQAVGVKVLGPKASAQQQPAQGQPQQAPAQSPKEARAERVKAWMNYRLFYGMEDWEGDVDAMLNQIPITGMGFKKVYYKPGYGVCSEYVSALNLTVQINTTSLQRCPRITQDYERYPYELTNLMKAGVYNDVELDQTSDDDDDQAPRVILEQYRMHDLDDDGVEEPYIVTVDKESQKVLRIEADYGPEDVILRGEDVIYVKRWLPYVEFPFMPDPKGRFYAMGFGHLLAQITAAINSGFNQLIDAGHAQIAGGGFISSGLRIQGGGQTSSLRFKPSEYKVVNASGGDIRSMIFERTVPAPSPVMYQMLEMLMDAAKDISSVKDVLTGDAPSNAPVGTTMALIEQGLQSFTAIYKRVYRSLKAEFRLIYECESRYADDEVRRAYAEFFDGDPAADFDADFSPDGADIVPISDPTVVTKTQQLAKAQFAMQFMGQPWANSAAIMKRSLEAADIDDPDELIAPPPTGPTPAEKAELDKTESETQKNQATALKAVAEAGQITGQHEAKGAFDAGVHAELGGSPDMAGKPGDAVGAESAPDSSGSPAPGMDQPDMGAGPFGGAGPMQPPAIG